MRLTDGQEPQQWIGPQTLLKIAAEALVVGHLRVERIGRGPLLTVLDRRVLTRDQVHVKAQEHTQQQGKHARQDVTRHDEVCDAVVKGLRVHQSLQHDRVAGRDYQQRADHGGKYHAEKVLVIVEADAVGDPRTVMVHLQDARVTLRTVVGTVGLRLVAPLADADAAELFLLIRNDVRRAFGITRALRTALFAIGLLLAPSGQERPG